MKNQIRGSEKSDGGAGRTQNRCRQRMKRKTDRINEDKSTTPKILSELVREK